MRLNSSKFVCIATIASPDASDVIRHASEVAPSLPTRKSALSSVHVKNGASRLRACDATSLHAISAFVIDGVMGLMVSKGSADETALLRRLTSKHAASNLSMRFRCSTSHWLANDCDGTDCCCELIALRDVYARLMLSSAAAAAEIVVRCVRRMCNKCSHDITAISTSRLVKSGFCIPRVAHSRCILAIDRK